MGARAHVTVSVHLDADTGMAVRLVPVPHESLVVLDLGGVSLFVTEVAALDALAGLVAEARQLLAQPTLLDAAVAS